MFFFLQNLLSIFGSHHFELNLLLVNISALRSTPAEVRGGGGRAALSHPAALKSGSKLQPELLGFKIFVLVIEVYFLET